MAPEASARETWQDVIEPARNGVCRAEVAPGAAGIVQQAAALLHWQSAAASEFLAFAGEQGHTAPRVRRLIVKHQAWWFIPMLLLQGFAIRLHSMALLLDKSAKFPVLEPLGMVIHVGLYLGGVFSCLGVWAGMAFILVHQMLFGLYMGSVFAPNHQGMLMLRGDCPLDRLHQQVLTPCNVRAHPVTDFWFGGPNYQIEHHLFPSMPRNQLKAAQATVRAFWQARAIPSHETSI
jgi:fatty acid desaturase